MFEASLGTWNAHRTGSFLAMPGLWASAVQIPLELLESGDPRWWEIAIPGLAAFCVVTGLPWLYWLLLGAVNSWTVVANKDGVIARYGPLPSLAGERVFRGREIRGLLTSASAISTEARYSSRMRSWISCGIDVLLADGSCERLVYGCRDPGRVSKAKREIERALGLPSM